MKPLFLPLLFALTTFIGCTSDNSKSVPIHPPNIVFLFADDQTYTAVHTLGNSEIETPNLDRLTQQGTTFTHAYNMGGWNGAICVASRAMLISGRSVWRANQFRQNWLEGKELDKSWGRLLQQQGYATYMSGKWHVDAPADSVFQTVAHVRPGMPDDPWRHAGMGERFKQLAADNSLILADIMPLGYHRPKDENDTSWSPSDTTFGGYWEGGKHWSEVLKDDALGFIATAQESEQPFFMYLAFNAPHDPRQAPQEYVDKYPLEQISLPESWLPEYPLKDSIGNGPDLRDEALAPFPRTEYATKKHIQEYYAIVSHLDTQLGKILDALEASGKMDNTYIFFTADHGLSVGRHGLLGKQSLYDHSIRVPLMLVGPDIPKGKRIDTDVYLQDIMPTSLELAGIAKPGYVEFHSLLPLAKGTQQESNYAAIYGCYANWQRMIRKDGFKLIAYPRAGQLLLFDLQNDPEEITNLADNPDYADTLARLFEELVQLQGEMGDELDLGVLRR